MAKNASKLVYDDLEEGWKDTVQLPALADCVIRWSVDNEDISGPYKPDETKAQRAKLPVILCSESGDEPTKVQRDSLKKFLAKQDAICKKLLKYALQQLSDIYYDECLLPLDDCTGKTKAVRKKFDTVAGFQELIHPTCLYVREEEKNGIAYIAIDFNTALDEEHGFSILLHDGKPLGWAGAGEMGGDIPRETTATEKGDFQAELAEYAEVRSRLADVLKLATDPETAAKIVDQIPPLGERLKAALVPINARLNDPDPRSTMAVIKALQSDSANKTAGKKLAEQQSRIAGDKALWKVVGPALEKGLN